MDQHTLAVRAQSHAKIFGALLDINEKVLAPRLAEFGSAVLDAVRDDLVRQLEPTIGALRAINELGPTLAKQRAREVQVLSDAQARLAAIDDRLVAGHGPNER